MDRKTPSSTRSEVSSPSLSTSQSLTSSSTSRRLRKRPLSSADLSASAISAKTSKCTESDRQSIEQSLKCPICLQIFDEPYSTTCGHSFCRSCITKSVSFRPKCPECDFSIENAEKQVFLNHSLATIAQQFKDGQRREKKFMIDVPSSSKNSVSASLFTRCLTDPTVDLQTVARMINLLQRKKFNMQTEDRQTKFLLLREFIDEMISRRQLQMTKITSEIDLLKKDREEISQKINNSDKTHRLVPQSLETASSTNSAVVTRNLRRQHSAGNEAKLKVLETEPDPDVQMTEQSESFTAAQMLLKRRQRMSGHFDDLEKSYFADRTGEALGITGTTRSETNLDEFGEVLTKLTQYNSVRRLANLNYSIEYGQGLSIVSSIEFDKDGEYFVVAGVTKKIKLYDYNTVLEDRVDIHYPIGEMHCNSKISCVSWNPYTKSLLASSDYEGAVQLWDSFALKGSQKFQEHEKRCWSVNFSSADPKLLASGSDDAKVKIWEVNHENSVQTINAGVNVCSVHFNPTSRNHIAFGSADHCVHHYDIRNSRKPVAVFRGHKKAVSYVKFLNSTEIVSASTDSHLRIWSTESGQCVRTLKGHQNEKNFVGLATSEDYIACGSENNNLYVYYKDLSRPLIAYNFGTEAILPLIGGAPESGRSLSRSSSVASNVSRVGRETESTDFVSAVCWKKNSNVLVAANSQGVIQVLELI